LRLFPPHEICDFAGTPVGDPCEIPKKSCDFSGTPVSVLVLMEPGDASRQALTLARKFGEPLHAVHTDCVEPFAPDALAAVLLRAANELQASAVLAAGTERGNEVMARLAARSGLPFAANCVAVAPGQPVAVTRLRWGGSLLEEALLRSTRPLITVAPHMVPIEAGLEPTDVDVQPWVADLDERDLMVRVSDHVAPPGGGVSLTTAKVIVSGGRGVGSKEGFAIIEELAGLLGAAVGCSRAVTSAGWRPHTDQVGQTGTKVAPEVYIACGISGATQHMAGLKGAKRILAINSDPQAPMMLNADYAVVGDLKEIVPAISAEIRRTRAGRI
jgi:electron transfer flavoprotein alpha subunit